MRNENRILLTRRQLICNSVALAAVSSTSRAFSQEDHRWTIGNDRVSRTVVFKSGAGLYTESFADPATGAHFITPENLRMAAEFSFDCNGRSYSGSKSAFELLGADLSQGNSLTVRLLLRDLGLEVHAIYRVYSGHPVIRKHLLLRNTGSTALKFTHMNIEVLWIGLGPENEIILNTQYGAIPREIFYTGRSEDAGLFVSNSRTGNGLAIVSEVPGYMKRTEIAGWHDPERVQVAVLYDTDLMPFERTIAPGEEFATAAASLAAFRNGDGFHDPRWVLPSYTAKVLERRVDRRGPPWIYNTWEPFQRTIDYKIAADLIDAAGTMGMDIFTIDDGWQQEYGDNAVNLTAFPGGLQTIQDEVKARGMRLGLWIPMAAIGMDTEAHRNHPEWAAQDLEGKPKSTGTASGSKAVMCLASPYRDVAADRINDAIARFDLAYVKLDLTTIFNAYGEAPGCWAHGHYHHSWAESLNMIYESIAYVTAKIYAKHPDVLLDLTFELWGQKHIIDAGLLAAGDLDWLSNVDDVEPDSAGPIQARELLYQRSPSMPVESMLIGNIHAEFPTIQESFATAIGSAPLLLGDLRKLSQSDRAWFHEKITWFKGLRAQTQISESFFPLGSWRQTAASKWDGFARLAHSGEGVIVLFRNKSEAASATVQIEVMAPGRFRLHSVMSGKDIGKFSQEDFARGIPIPLVEPVEILEVRSAG
jgi:alpha-galactosidase